MSKRNPLIDSTMPDQTLQNVSSVVSYLQVAEPPEGCEADENTQHGLYLLLSCVREALEYEVAAWKHCAWQTGERPRRQRQTPRSVTNQHYQGQGRPHNMSKMNETFTRFCRDSLHFPFLRAVIRP